MNKEEFKRRLDMGMKAENEVYDYLCSTFQYVQNTRYQDREKFKGPRLNGTARESLILPDFVVYDSALGRYAVEVKSKSVAYPIDGKRCFTVDHDKYLDYLKVVELMGLDDLVLVFVHNWDKYWYTSKEYLRFHQFPTGYSVLFQLDASRRI